MPELMFIIYSYTYIPVLPFCGVMWKILIWYCVFTIVFVIVFICLFCQGGCVDSSTQSLALLMMALGDKDVSKVKLGPLSPYT